MAEEKKVITIHLPRVNIWMVFTVILAILLVVFYFKGWSFTGMAVALTPKQAADKAIDYINKNLVQTGEATFVSVEEMSGVYKVLTSYQGQQIPIYITKDGLYLFVSQPIVTSKETPKEQPKTIPKTDKPLVELFVMSFCPYGMQAENLMKPVVDLLGTKADIKVRFIANVQGDTIDSVRSLHGSNEAMEDLRQLCIMKYYDQKTFWTYLMEINANCPSVYRNASALDKCWKDAATKAKIDITKIDTCSKSSEGLNLLKADEQLTEKYGVTGSPTLIINGASYSGARSSEAFKQAICSAFNTQPAECSQTLRSSGASTGEC